VIRELKDLPHDKYFRKQLFQRFNTNLFREMTIKVDIHLDGFEQYQISK